MRQFIVQLITVRKLFSLYYCYFPTTIVPDDYSTITYLKNSMPLEDWLSEFMYLFLVF